MASADAASRWAGLQSPGYVLETKKTKHFRSAQGRRAPLAGHLMKRVPSPHMLLNCNNLTATPLLSKGGGGGPSCKPISFCHVERSASSRAAPSVRTRRVVETPRECVARKCRPREFSPERVPFARGRIENIP